MLSTKTVLPLHAALLLLLQLGGVGLFHLLPLVGLLLFLGPRLLLHVFQTLGQLLALLRGQILAGQGLFQGLLDLGDLGLVLPAVFGQNLVQVLLRELGRLWCPGRRGSGGGLGIGRA